ncbi:hypothetical protein M408DRAFT_85015 [Serendipita vermifera MAFF 305830]|uniref:Uncharacterized protein n=1 Tax=Serendipita vermifera MAFF 305830 TaxID=933852 RepID=A0A0C2X6Q8_SERVB|nr:hypothetical protein M408DRAFT_85015 [Serendipita vermifera MAFF 305830]
MLADNTTAPRVLLFLYRIEWLRRCGRTRLSGSSRRRTTNRYGVPSSRERERTTGSKKRCFRFKASSGRSLPWSKWPDRNMHDGRRCRSWCESRVY